MVNRFKIWVAVLLLSGVSVAMGQDVSVADSLPFVADRKGGEYVSKSQADEAYAEGNYAEAARLYEQIIVEQGISSVLYYNLGNSYYKCSELAKAILNYERSLLLNPGDADTRFNLELAKSKTVDRITPLSELFFVTWAKDIANLQSSDAWAKVAIVTFMAFILSLSVYFFNRKPAMRRTAFFTALLLLLVSIVSNFSSSYQKGVLENRAQAIVMSPSVTVKSTPANSGTDLFVLHEGCKVEVKDNSMRNWKEIRIADGNVGWIPAEAIEII